MHHTIEEKHILPHPTRKLSEFLREQPLVFSRVSEDKFEQGRGLKCWGPKMEVEGSVVNKFGTEEDAHEKVLRQRGW